MIDPHIEAPDLTPAEAELVQVYVEALSLVSGCAEALDDGNWNHLAERASQLRDAADTLQSAADVTRATDPAPRAAAVRAAVRRRAADHHAVALLHPARASTSSKTTSSMLDPFRSEARRPA